MASDGRKLLDLIADFVGDEKVAEFLELRGGGHLILPAKPKDDHWFSAFVGSGDIARKIVEGMGYTNHKGEVSGLRIAALPIAERGSTEKNRREVERRLRLGQTTSRIAREVGVSRRTVQRHRAAMKKRMRQNAAFHTEGPTKC